jgi:hypothetical protein
MTKNERELKIINKPGLIIRNFPFMITIMAFDSRLVDFNIHLVERSNPRIIEIKLMNIPYIKSVAVILIILFYNK